MKSPHRSDFLQNVKPGEKYADIVGIYRHNSSSDFIGIFDAEIINSLPESLKWIAHNGAGYDQIDVAACKAKGEGFGLALTTIILNANTLTGIKVSNTPGAVDDATATTGMYLLISAARQFSIAEREARAGRWKSNLKPAHDPSALTLSILGLGGIGLQLAKLAHAFPMKRILYHSRHKRDDAPDWIEYCPDLHKMLAETDVLSVHVPLRRETEGFIGEKEIRALKKGAIIVNTARGKLIDEDALIRALEDGHVGCRA
jgi:glyoxylate reductase